MRPLPLAAALVLALTPLAPGADSPVFNGPHDTVPPTHEPKPGGPYPHHMPPQGRPLVGGECKGATVPPNPAGLVQPPAPAHSPGPPSPAPILEPSWRRWWDLVEPEYLRRRSASSSTVTSGHGDDFWLGFGATTPEPEAELDPKFIRDSIIPALAKGIDRRRDAYTRRAALVALARAARAASVEAQARALIEARLSRSDYGDRSAGLIALGIVADERTSAQLRGLLADTKEGRRLIGGWALQPWLRVHTALALAQAAKNVDSGERLWIDLALLDVVEEESVHARPDVAVAALVALATIDRTRDGAVASEVANRLLDTYTERRRLSPEVRARIPLAVARILARRSNPTAEPWARAVETFATPIDRRSQRVEALDQRGLAVALGELGRAGDDESSELLVRALEKLARFARSPESRRLAWLSLGRTCGRPGPSDGEPFAQSDDILETLVRELRHGNGQDRVWSALALGIAVDGLRTNNGPLDVDVVHEMRDALDGTMSRDDAGAYAIALGIARDPGAGELFEAQLDRGGPVETLRHVATAAALADARTLAGELERLVHRSKMKPVVFCGAGIGAVILGNRDLESVFVERATRSRNMPVRAAATTVLELGLRRESARALADALADPRTKRQQWAWIATALGAACDRDHEPFDIELRRTAIIDGAAPSLQLTSNPSILGLASTAWWNRAKPTVPGPGAVFAPAGP